MRKLIVLPALGAAAALAVMAVPGSTSPTPSSVDTFVSLATAGVYTDYEPLASPSDAIAKGDLVVDGVLTDVLDGVRPHYPDPGKTRRHANSLVTLVITVTGVIDGDAGKLTNGQVYVAMTKSAFTTRAELSAANPRPRVVAVLDDITTSVPEPGVTVTRPAAMPADAPLYAAYTDGLWLQASGDAAMSGIGAHRDELTPAWRQPEDVHDVAAALHEASGG